MRDGTTPAPGGWSRFVFEINYNYIDGLVAKLKEQGMTFKDDILRGGGRARVLCEDPSGNVIKLMQRDTRWFCGWPSW